MILFAVLSFIIPSPKLALAVWLAGFACIGLSLLLVFTGTTTIQVSRWLNQSEKEDVRQHFDIPFVQYSATGEGHRLRVRRADDSDALRAYLTKIGVLLPKD
jgi:hypothetical protein